MKNIVKYTPIQAITDKIGAMTLNNPVSVFALFSEVDFADAIIKPTVQIERKNPVALAKGIKSPAVNPSAWSYNGYWWTHKLMYKTRAFICNGAVYRRKNYALSAPVNTHKNRFRLPLWQVYCNRYKVSKPTGKTLALFEGYFTTMFNGKFF